ncbi:hypothetical protein BD309DRAFT_871149 [Dichomitus squalens]|uniref:Uncharacterized protein n=1 Tax=Dichomitus squalens TaxID=114155 RepID=A0A4Q9Q6G5_9APHY|nr:uncharacterized protein DICSQDRAFT_131560 [Dichomitus squalens LYAD-421 SS1]EJF67281.1 hypothetical protein DICSQDRAFT_131560 [Dichomitus squalens LYAD-421 SS1]TBU40022.1 hypothetical protein BD309DRAFT_871149 [Dichomitus squalens]TBU62551.1 hypothetical protein BD310DRAFT_810880 [Dichomitus squalens]
MSSIYTSPPSSPIASFFPTGPSSPHAFASFQQDPRNTHTMFAALASGSPHNAAQGQAIAMARAGHTPTKKSK